MGGYLGHGGAGVDDRVGDVLGTGRGARHEDAGYARLARVHVLVRLGDVVVGVQIQYVAGEEAFDLAVGLDPDGQDDHVVLGLDDRPAVLDVLVAKDQVAVGLLGDPGDAALDVGGAHRLRAFVELVVSLARRTDVHVVDRNLGQGQGAHDELVLLDRIHA